MRTVYAMAVRLEPMATVARCVGVDEETLEVITFGVDHRPARTLGSMIEQAGQEGAKPPLARVEDWQVLSINDPDPELNKALT